MNNEELLNITSSVGQMLLENGAEIYRVEESMTRIITAYGAQGGVFAIPTSLIATVSAPDGPSLTKTKRITSRGINFEKVIRLNDLCRRICRETPDFASIEAELTEIEHSPSYSKPAQLLACAAVSLFFTLFFGGSLADACCAFVVGIFMKITVMKLEQFHTNSFFIYIIASAVTAAAALLAVHFQLGTSLDKITIGVFMNLVPGVAMTNAIRDTIAGDLVAGQSRLLEALLIGTGLALGAGIAISVTQMLWTL